VGLPELMPRLDGDVVVETSTKPVVGLPVPGPPVRIGVESGPNTGAIDGVPTSTAGVPDEFIVLISKYMSCWQSTEFS
jgi:hypothetical protein